MSKYKVGDRVVVYNDRNNFAVSARIVKVREPVIHLNKQWYFVKGLDSVGFNVEESNVFDITLEKDTVGDAIRPTHYKQEMDLFTSWEKTMQEAECRGAYKSIIDRYVKRYDRKNGLEDLHKARETLDRLIQWEESK